MSVFTEISEEQIAAFGEKRLLRHIRQWLGTAAPDSPFGMGDDCAVLPPCAHEAGLVTTDSLVLGRHFSAQMDPHQVGAKLLLRNLSDIAAMGGQPLYAVVAGFLPRVLSVRWLEPCIRGMAACADEFQVKIVGGDLAESPHDLALNLTLFGKVPSGSRPLLRSGASPGDLICVTGELGGSFPVRHLAIRPRIAEGRLLARFPEVIAAMDISDGTAIDLACMLPDETSAYLETASIPLHPDAHCAAERSGKSPLWHALNDGEDHELIIILRVNDDNALACIQAELSANRLQALHPIGRVGERGEAAILDAATGRPFPDLSGYDHFR